MKKLIEYQIEDLSFAANLIKRAKTKRGIFSLSKHDGNKLLEIIQHIELELRESAGEKFDFPLPARRSMMIEEAIFSEVSLLPTKRINS